MDIIWNTGIDIDSYYSVNEIDSYYRANEIDGYIEYI